LRDKKLNISSFNAEVEKIIFQNLQILEIENRITAVIDNSYFQLEKRYFFDVEKVTLNEWLFLATVMWYLPEEFRFLLLLDLEKRSTLFSLEDRILCEQFLKSKAQMLIFLQETRRWHTRDFYGNFLKNLWHVLDNLLKVKPLRLKKPTYPQRKRGYNDKGRGVPNHKKLGDGKYIIHTKEFKEEELKKQIYQDTLLLIQGMLE
jgi:hypothetical protein